MSQSDPIPPTQSRGERPSSRALRASLILPIAISVIVWLVGLVVYLLAPGSRVFNTVIALLIGAGLLVYLTLSLRTAPRRLQIQGLLMAAPALLGITLGLVNGRSRPVVIGVGVTFLLLAAQRALNVPFSYRAAWRHFQQQQYESALTLINKSIAARPDFAESYQLRALIRLVFQQPAAALRDIQQAIQLQPRTHPFYNTLGQIHLSQGDYPAAQAAYEEALALNPDLSMYHYHLGLCALRQGQHRAAAAAFATAQRKGTPTLTTELLTHFYLGLCLEKINEPALAAEAYAKMAQFAEGVPDLTAQVEAQPETPLATALAADLPVLRARLTQVEENAKQ